MRGSFPDYKSPGERLGLRATCTTHGFGGPYIRGPYSPNRPAWKCALLAMQGLGKPGVHQLCFIEGTFLAYYVLGHEVGQPTPIGKVRPSVRDAYRGAYHRVADCKQIIPKTMVHDAILDGKFEIYGSSDQMDPAG